jgi:hypothetical protein
VRQRRGGGRATRGGRSSTRGGVGPDRQGTAWAAWRVRTGEAPGSLTHGTRPAAGEGGRNRKVCDLFN